MVGYGQESVSTEGDSSRAREWRVSGPNATNIRPSNFFRVRDGRPAREAAAGGGG